MGNAARIMVQRLSRTPATTPDALSEQDREVLQRMQQRGIVSGVVDDDTEPWDEKVLRVLREDQEWQAQYEAGRAQREAEAGEADLTLPQLLKRAIGGENTSSHMPLNGPQVLRAALGGTSGTINGQPA